jgi:3-(3-hydroxy-phenyl)propionate hydroxylase
VVIVGAGPVGLVCALRLAQANIASVVLEASPTLPHDLRASTVHPPTLEILEDLGVLDEFMAMGVITRT